MTQVKICGLRDAVSLHTVAEGEADFAGVGFVPGVRRSLTPEQARAVLDLFRSGLQGPSPRIVGLFANQPLEQVNALAQSCSLDLVQLCGQEPVEYCRGAAVPVIKVVHVRSDAAVAQETERVLGEVQRYIKAGALITLDRHVDGAPGGSGLSFNWEVAEQVAQRFPFLLAGGLTPENIGDAIQRVRPWGVDVSSGVETNGVKDPVKIRAFINNVRLHSNEQPYPEVPTKKR